MRCNLQDLSRHAIGPQRTFGIRPRTHSNAGAGDTLPSSHRAFQPPHAEDQARLAAQPDPRSNPHTQRGPCLYIGKGLVAYGGSIGGRAELQGGLDLLRAAAETRGAKTEGYLRRRRSSGCGALCQTFFEDLLHGD